MLKISLTLFFIMNCILSGFAQNKPDTFKYTDGHELSILGRPFNYFGHYQRLDSSDRRHLIRRVKELSTNSAGININFRTNAASIEVEWDIPKQTEQLNMTPIAHSGVDLYGKKHGLWQFIAAGRPADLSNKVLLVDHMPVGFTDYKLYLPLYNEVTRVRIGVPDTAVIIKPDEGPQKRVVIYGSSITQGASASRPGMAYPSLIARKQNIETINLGFSGSGTMETEIVDVLARIDADLYILDCVPNPSPKMIAERAYDFVTKLRRLKPGVPVIMVESIFRETGHWNLELGKKTTQQNLEFRKAFEHARKGNKKGLYYIRAEKLIGNDHEATIDGTHLTDLGFTRIAEAIGKEIKKRL